MNILTKSTTLKWWQLSLFKIAVTAIGIVIGATWSSFFLPYTTALLTVGVGLSIYIGIIWFKR